MIKETKLPGILDTAIFIAVVVVITFILLKLMDRMLRKNEERNGKRIHVKFFYNIMRMFVFLLAVSAIGGRFERFSTTVNTLLASSGILALGVSLAAQESLSNIIDGLFISMFKPFNIGDRVSLPEKNNLTGFVTEMNLRHTVITTFSNASYIVPNSVMSSSVIDNSNYKNQTFAYPIDVSVSYDSDLELALRLLTQAVTSHPEFADPRSEADRAAGKPAVTPLVRNFGASGIELRCMMYTANVNQSFNACSDVRIAVKKLFDENGIVIPYTTITLNTPSAE